MIDSGIDGPFFVRANAGIVHDPVTRQISLRVIIGGPTKIMEKTRYF